MGVQPEIKEEKEGEGEKERETWGKPVQRLAPSSNVQRAFYTFDKTWRSMGNTKLCREKSLVLIRIWTLTLHNFVLPIDLHVLSKV